MTEDSIIIRNKDGNLVRELVVLWNPRIPWMVQYAIKLHTRHYLMISREKFNRIINTARENGFLVFDYTNFY